MYFLNGVNILNNADANVFAPNTLNSLDFSENGNTLPFFGKTKALAVWKEALSDQELADLTYPTPTDPTFALNFDTIATDFTFARNSEATYVDAQGLIKSTNELGAEEITNGTFDSDTAWTKGSGWSIGGGYANYNTSSNNTLSQAGGFVDGKTYKVTLEVKSYVRGTPIIVINSGASVQVPRAIGIHTMYVVAGTSATKIFRYYGGGFSSGGEGSIDNVSVKEYITETNTPRLDYSTGAEAFLLEPASRNLIAYSNDYADAYWIKATSGSGIAPIVTSNYAISPDGTQNADRIQFDATTSGSNSDRSRIRTTLTLSDVTDYTFSFYAKSTDGTDQKISILFDNSQISIKTITSEWQRFEASRQQVGTSSICGLDLRGGNASTSDILVYGIQIEALPYATSYIPTENNPNGVSRNQETCINATPEINSEEGVLYAEISSLTNAEVMML